MKALARRNVLIAVAAIAAFAIPLGLRRLMGGVKAPEGGLGYFDVRFAALLALAVLAVVLALAVAGWVGRRVFPHLRASAVGWLLMVALLLTVAGGAAGVAGGAAYIAGM